MIYADLVARVAEEMVGKGPATRFLAEPFPAWSFVLWCHEEASRRISVEWLLPRADSPTRAIALSGRAGCRVLTSEEGNEGKVRPGDVFVRFHGPQEVHAAVRKLDPPTLAGIVVAMIDPGLYRTAELGGDGRVYFGTVAAREARLIGFVRAKIRAK